MSEETTQKKRILIGAGVAGGILVVLGAIIALQFLGKPLQYQYTEAKRAVDETAKVQAASVAATNAYFAAISNADGPVNTNPNSMVDGAKKLDEQTESLSRLPGIYKDDQLKVGYTAYQKNEQGYSADVRAVAESLRQTATAKNACTKQTFEKAYSSTDSTDARRIFSPCLKAMLAIDLGKVADADYKTLLVGIRKAYNDYDKALGSGDGIEDAKTAISVVSANARTVDSKVQQRLQERASKLDISALQESLARKTAAGNKK